MKREKIRLTEERKIITNMIVDTRFLREIMPVIKIEYLESSYAKLLFKWIKEYWNTYKESPGKNIQDIYLHKSQTIKNEDDTELIGEYLQNLSDDYEKLTNVKYSIKKAVLYLKVQSLKYIKEKIESSIKANDPLYGEKSITDYVRVEKPQGEGVSLLRDNGKIVSAFLMEDEKLFTFPKELGKVVGNFIRGDLVAYLAASGRGKTWWQLYTAITSLYHGYRSVFFTLEMPENQIVRRAWQSLTNTPKEDTVVKLPHFISPEKKNGKYKIGYEEISKKSFDKRNISEKQKTYRLQFKGGDIKIIAVPAYSATTDDIEAYLDNLDYYDSYIPDVIVIDYADLIKPNTNRLDYRHQLDIIWKSLRRMAQERNALVVTASQTDRSSFSKDAGEINIAEDIRKIAHVSKMLVINQNKEDYKEQAVRISSLKERDEKRYIQEVVVLQCLDIGLCFVDSKYRNKVILKNGKNED